MTEGNDVMIRSISSVLCQLNIVLVAQGTKTTARFSTWSTTTFNDRELSTITWGVIPPLNQNDESLTVWDISGLDF
jgi:hypothetical protein